MDRLGEVSGDKVMARRLGAALGRLFVIPLVILMVGTASSVAMSGHAGATTSPKAHARAPSHRLTAPKTSFAQDTKFFTDVTEADPAFVTYEQQQGNTALRALLTDGSAFCALLRQGGGIDRALVSEAAGARSSESTTHLPLSVTTFNTIEAVALISLCPTEQTLLPASDRSRIRALGNTLAHRPR